MLIYIIDDLEMELACWARTLTEHAPDWNFKLCGTFEELNDAIGQAAPDVALIDYIMPFHDGVRVNGYLRKFYPTVKRIICSGMDAEPYQQLAVQTGAGFISKAVPHKDRIGLIRAYMEDTNG